MSKELKSCLFCGKNQKQVDKAIEVIVVIMKYKDDVLFLSNFITGDWEGLPLEARKLIKKLRLKSWNKSNSPRPQELRK